MLHFIVANAPIKYFRNLIQHDQEPKTVHIFGGMVTLRHLEEKATPRSIVLLDDEKGGRRKRKGGKTNGKEVEQRKKKERGQVSWDQVRWEARHAHFAANTNESPCTMLCFGTTMLYPIYVSEALPFHYHTIYRTELEYIVPQKSIIQP